MSKSGDVAMAWQAAVQRQQTHAQVLDVENLRRFAIAIGADPRVENVMPPLAHWAFFLPSFTNQEIGPDGHARLGEAETGVPLPRRMFAAADIEFVEPLDLGQRAELTTTLQRVTHKSGRSGDLVFVEVEYVLTQNAEARTKELRTYVYRDAARAIPMPRPAATPLDGEQWMPDETQLFRFSAATFNAHRIHYDLPYATGVEGYPALVIHGPYTASKLAVLAARRAPLKRFSFRAEAPLFLGQTVFLQAQKEQMRAVRCDGAVAVSASARFR